MSNNTAASVGIVSILICLAIVGLGLWGYVDNILTLISANSFGIVEIVRLVGIFLAPVGVLMGWFA